MIHAHPQLNAAEYNFLKQLRDEKAASAAADRDFSKQHSWLSRLDTLRRLEAGVLFPHEAAEPGYAQERIDSLRSYLLDHAHRMFA